MNNISPFYFLNDVVWLNYHNIELIFPCFFAKNWVYLIVFNKFENTGNLKLKIGSRYVLILF